jgi:anti-anti-sigma factor
VSAQPIQSSPELGSEAARARPEFSAHRRHMARGVCVALTGELDLAGVPAAASQRRRAQSEGRDVLLDLSALTFMDVSGLQMIVAADTRARHHHGRLTIRCGRSCARRLFELAGVDRALELTDDRPVNGASP